MRPNWQLSLAIATLMPILGIGCSAPNEVCSAGSSTPAMDVASASVAEDETWEDKLWQYVETHEPDADANPVVRPNSAPIRAALVDAGARILHEFTAFNGVLISMKVRDLPNLLEIEHNIQVSFGSDSGELMAIPPCT